MGLTEKQKEVFSRQIMMQEIGEEGQQKLADSSVLVVGCGGLGSPVLYYLTAMGIGHIGLCDGDIVSLPNLNRQILFTMEDIGKSKVSVSKDRLNALNPDLKITEHDQLMNEELADKIIPKYDIVVDCLDNFETRFILNDACIKAKKPLIHAGIGEFYGQLMTIIPGKTPCLRCLFPKGIKTCQENRLKATSRGVAFDTFGVVGTTPGVLGTMQAIEVMKYILEIPSFTEGMLVVDTLNQTMEKVKIKQNQKCICTE